MAARLGDFLICIQASGASAPHARIDDPARWPALGAVQAPVARHVAGPGITVWTRGDITTQVGDVGAVALINAPGAVPVADLASDVAAWRHDAQWRPSHQRGRYVWVLWDAAAQRVEAFVDAFRTYPVVYAQTPHGVVVASDIRLLLATGWVRAEVDPVAIYHYLNFSYVPAPVAAIRGVQKLTAGCALRVRGGAVHTSRHWDAVYPEDVGGSEDARAAQLREQIVQTVQRYRPAQAEGWGTFLSGGTDSSSISGILARQDAQAKVKSFSIGFAEPGYDELGYSQIASRYFGLDAHELRVSEDDAVDLVPRLAQAYDEPFGNSSAIPTFYCADLAVRHGVDLMVAGDGGDEIFGGNERYRKDVIFEWFHQAPALVRGAGHLAAGALRGVDARWANRIKNFVHRGTLPNPDRFYSDDSFASDHFEELLSAAFRSQVDVLASLDLQRQIYAQAQASSTLHKLMYLDLRMTIADNDVVKVVRAAKLAGASVAFPYLDQDLIAFTGRLPVHDKVHRLNKRHLFKRAVEDILPIEIRQKKKQGFGLPVSVWMRRPGRFQDMVKDIVLSPRALSRGYCEAEYVQHLMRRHERGAWDHASEIYLLLMLELWHRTYVDNDV